MSTKYKTPEEVPNETIIKRLNELTNAILKGRVSIDREFTMRIPAELDHDADLVLAIAAKRLTELQEENAKLKKQWEELRQFMGRMYLNGKISAESSGPIYAKMKELEAQDG